MKVKVSKNSKMKMNSGWKVEGFGAGLGWFLTLDYGLVNSMSQYHFVHVYQNLQPQDSLSLSRARGNA